MFYALAYSDKINTSKVCKEGGVNDQRQSPRCLERCIISQCTTVITDFLTGPFGFFAASSVTSLIHSMSTSSSSNIATNSHKFTKCSSTSGYVCVMCVITLSS